MLPYFKAFISNSCYISFMFTQFALVLCTLWTLHTEISIGKRLNQKKFNHSFCYSNRILTMMSIGANILKSFRSYLILHILLIKNIYHQLLYKNDHKSIITYRDKHTNTFI